MDYLVDDLIWSHTSKIAVTNELRKYAMITYYNNIQAHRKDWIWGRLASQIIS